MSNDSEPLADPTVSVDRDGNNNVRVTVWTDLLEGEHFRFTLNPGAALAVLRDLANIAASAVPAAAASIAAGECDRCGNVRMVQVEDRGRASSEHCPECGDRYRDARRGDFPARPLIGSRTEATA